VLPELISIKVKVLTGGFELLLGDNIAILSMVKQAHLLSLTNGTLDKVGRVIVCIEALHGGVVSAKGLSTIQ
jgi:hypothetical protein